MCDGIHFRIKVGSVLRKFDTLGCDFDASVEDEESVAGAVFWDSRAVGENDEFRAFSRCAVDKDVLRGDEGGLVFLVTGFPIQFKTI